MLFAFITILLALAVMMEYARSAKILYRRVEYLHTSNSLYQRMYKGCPIDVGAEKKILIGNLRKKAAVAYFVVILFHSVIYTSLHLS